MMIERLIVGTEHMAQGKGSVPMREEEERKAEQNRETREQKSTEILNSAEGDQPERKLDGKLGRVPQRSKFLERIRIPLSDEPKAWDLMVDEPDVWYTRFICYLTLGPERSVRAAWIQYHTEAGNHERLENINRKYLNWQVKSSEWNWVKRSRAFDLEVAEYLKTSYQQDLIETRARHRRQAMLLQSLAMKRLKYMKDLVNDSEDRIEDMTIVEALRLMSEGIKQELLALEQPELILQSSRGSPAESGGTRVRSGEQLDLSQLTIEELENLQKIVSKAGGAISVSARGIDRISDETGNRNELNGEMTTEE